MPPHPAASTSEEVATWPCLLLLMSDREIEALVAQVPGHPLPPAGLDPKLSPSPTLRALSDFLRNSDGKAPEGSPHGGSVRSRYSGTWIFDQALRYASGT